MNASQPDRGALDEAVNSAFATHLTVRPDEWALDERGAPLWLATLVPSDGPGWYHVDAMPPVLGRRPADATPRQFAMPQLDPRLHEAIRLPSAPRRRGRKGLKEEVPHECCWKAWLADVALVPFEKIAAEDYVPSRPKRPSSDLKNLARRAQTRIAAGRERLNADRVFPWMLWDAGRLTPEWWRSPNLRILLELWVRHTRVLAALNKEVESRIEHEARGLVDWAETELARQRRPT